MRFLIFSDVHSNLEALNAVLSDSKRKGIDATFCLGDIVGYGADPNECVDVIASRANTSVCRGNHDAAVIDPSEREPLNYLAQAGVSYSVKMLTPESLSFLRTLPLVIESNAGFVAVHASPYRPGDWAYVMEPFEAQDAFRVMKHPLAFTGHTHFPAVYTNSGAVLPVLAGDRVRIHPGRKYLINVGSVGQPRDADPRAAYFIFDDDEQVAEVHRVDYDIDTAARKIVDAGLPPVLADRIRRGN